jgi:glycosyltransferase involved in cell wall biosynthesis
MIILHIVEPFASGVAVFVRSLTEAMPDDTHIIVHGERKWVMTAEEVKKNFPRKNVRFIRWRSAQRKIHPFKDFSAFSELYKILRRLKRKNLVDAVHLHSSKSGLLGRVACRMAGIDNVIYTPNGASFLSATNRIARYFYHQMEKIGSRFGGRVVCCSSSEQEQFSKLGIDAGYVNNGILLDNNETAAVKEGDCKKFRIVNSGRIEKQKNPERFNEIASYFEDMDQIQFIWIGDGEDKKLFTAKNIKVTGWVDNDAVHDHIAAADLYLSTSLYEGLSFAVLEALNLKKPVLLSNCTGNTDIVKNGINGSLFNTAMEANVKILQYYNNPDMLDVMGKFSAEICRKEFNVQENFKTYRELYAGKKMNIGLGLSSRAKWSFG